jgi:diguanylate cyclase (GGDEF)-like protein
MLSRRISISSWNQIWRALFVLTLSSIGLSVIITIIILEMTMTGEPGATISEHEVWVNAIAYSILIPGIVCPVIVYMLLVTLRELNLARAELDAVANGDPLTGLLNRRGFDAAGAGLIAQAGSRHQPVCALMCDIDSFKQVNDTHGHDCGDIAIRHVASIVKTVMEAVPNASVGRQGGDEFAVLVTGLSSRELAHYAEIIRQSVQSNPIAWNEDTIPLTVSLGTSMSAGGEETTVRVLLSRADRALYEAKLRGKNRVEAAAQAEAA